MTYGGVLGALRLSTMYGVLGDGDVDASGQCGKDRARRREVAGRESTQASGRTQGLIGMATGRL